MWKSVRGRKRCIVVAEGCAVPRRALLRHYHADTSAYRSFYEWLKKGNDRIPHHVKRKDGKLMCFAGMWDDVM